MKAKKLDPHPPNGERAETIPINPLLLLAGLGITPNPSPRLRAWLQFAEGLTEYRLGHFRSAVEWMEKVLREPGEMRYRDAGAYMVLAMAHHQIGNAAQARQALASGCEIHLPALNGQDGGAWIELFTCRQLRKEAEALVGLPTPSEAQPPR